MASLTLDPSKTVDPRSSLQRAHRHELLAFARSHNLPEVRHDMPSPLLIKILQRHGIFHIPINRTLGEPERFGGATMAPTALQAGTYPGVKHEPSLEISADDLLEAQYGQQPAVPTEQPADASQPSVTWLKSECKRRGLKVPRGATAANLRELLNGDVA